ncbi:MAG: toxin ChpB [Euryarchaeota archaeon ADurb.BinA087]|nr:MAG: toxin ChpB [Euryarchaeota archaeon ADurb.BinA087]
MKRGEIWLVDLSDAKGHEQRGERPALIMGSANGLVVVVPFTTTLSTVRFSHTFSVSPTPQNGLDHESIALVFQIVALDRERFIHKMGSIAEQQWEAITALAKDLLNLDE